MVEYCIDIAEVVGSIPTRPTMKSTNLVITKLSNCLDCDKIYL